MHRLLKSVVCASICCLAVCPSESRAENYLVDKSHASLIFGASHFGYSHTYGRFSFDERSHFVWDKAHPAASRFQLVIPVASIDTDDPKRDDHLRNADFFNAKQFPQILFQSTSVRPAQQNNSAQQGNSGGNKYEVVGNLTMHGVTKEVTLPVTKMGEGQGPYGKYRSGFSCQTTIKRSDFGMTNMIPSIGDEVAITISFEGIRQEAVGPGNIPTEINGTR